MCLRIEGEGVGGDRDGGYVGQGVLKGDTGSKGKDQTEKVKTGTYLIFVVVFLQEQE